MAKNQKPSEDAPAEGAAESAPEPQVAAPIEQPVASAPPLAGVRVRLLRDCEHGKVDAVIEMDAALAESLAGTVDADPAAVAYAESLAQ